jgi:hypothetical protein
MRQLMNRLNPIDRSFMDEFFSPVKYLGYANEMIEGEGTEEKPFVIHRKKLVDNVYHGWYDSDGGYHEKLIKE